MKHCWNEESQKWYEVETIGVDVNRCLGCYTKVRE
jgi:hypothetical protein